MTKVDFLQDILNSSWKSKFDKTKLTKEHIFNITHLMSGKVYEYYSCNVKKDNKSEKWLTMCKKVNK